MGLPTNQDERTAFAAFGQIVAAANYYSQTGQFTDAEKQTLMDNLQLLSRGNIAPLESVDRTSNLPFTPFFTATRQGVYLVMGYFMLTTPAAAGTATLNLSWNDGRLAQSENQLVNIPITGTGQKSFVKALVLGAGQSVNALVTLNGVTGSPVYSVYARVVEL